MDLKEHYRNLQRMYLSAPVNRVAYEETSIEISQGKAEISWPISEAYHHGAGGLHGSVYFKLLDDAAFFAVQSEVTSQFILTVSFNIYLLRPVSSGIIRSEGEIRSASKNLYTATAQLFDQKGREIAYGSGSFMPGRMPLEQAWGYLSDL